MGELEQINGGASGVLTQDEIDAIGEILNISMGSAATAMSSLLDKQVVITPPTVSLEIMDHVDYAALEPAILVKIQYVEGLSGSNIMLFRQNDMQVILNLLMGTDDPPRDDFEFDELSMSAACEVMNQMMGSSATALSEVLGTPVNISTPDAVVVTDQQLDKHIDIKGSEQVVAVSFGLMIKDVMNTNFVSVMTWQLAHMIIKQVLGDQQAAIESLPSAIVETPSFIPEPLPPQEAVQQTAPPMTSMPTPAPAAPLPQPSYPAVPDMMNSSMAGSAQGLPQQGIPQQGMPPQMGMQPGMMPPGGMQPQGSLQSPGYPPAMQVPPEYQQAMQYGMYYGYPPQMMGYPPQPVAAPQAAPNPQQAPAQQAAPNIYGGSVVRQPVNVQSAKFPDFNAQAGTPYAGGTNMGLLMNVPLNVTVEIGKTKRKIKDIMDFGQGTVIELDKQAGAPVDIIVNGQMIARGDVVVIEDNFGVRITEILGMKDLMSTLEDAGSR